MTYALIDNATLTGVQRITGDVATRSGDSVDTDIIALKYLIQAILFYDELIAIDDYIPEHKKRRQASFSYIRFLDANSYNPRPIVVNAARIAENLRPEIRGGEFESDDSVSTLSDVYGSGGSPSQTRQKKRTIHELQNRTVLKTRDIARGNTGLNYYVMYNKSASRGADLTPMQWRGNLSPVVLDYL